MANQEQLKTLEQGVLAWNKWRRENPNIEIDLSEAKLSQAVLFGVDLSFANRLDSISLISVRLNRDSS